MQFTMVLTKVIMKQKLSPTQLPEAHANTLTPSTVTILPLPALPADTAEIPIAQTVARWFLPVIPSLHTVTVMMMV